MSTFSNTDDVIDSRDIIERIEELQSDRLALKQALEEAEAALLEDDTEENQLAVDEARDDLTAWDNSHDAEELKTLEKLAEDVQEFNTDWEYCVTLIHESYFTEYTKETVTDSGYISKDFPDWIAVDWDKTAENVKRYYAEIDFDGETYFIQEC